MLKYLGFIIFMLFLLKLKNYFWLLQELFLLNFILMMFLSLPSFYYMMNFFMLMDYLSYGLIILSIWICSLMLMASKKIFFYSENKGVFMFLLIFLMIFLFLSFSVFNLFMFYLFFEMSLIPTLYLILGWGYQPERIQASFYLLFYTLFASLPLLMGIFLINFSALSLNYLMFNILEYFKNFSIFYLMMIMALLVKMPMFLVHLWLPKAHVEAPISGSMILAGLLLKLGGYGLVRVLMFLQSLNLYMNFYFISISLMGGVLISLNCLQQVDFKSLIAYSSVVHMGLILASMFNCSMWGILNSYLMMIAHGLCSSGLFCLANISYERLMNRSLLINKGLLMLMPSMSVWWFFLCSSNMSAPPTLNLLSEVGLLISILNWSMFSLLMIMLITFFSASYCLYLFSYSQHGNLFSLIFSYSSNSSREYLLLFLHWVPLNILILKSEFFLFWL